MGSSAATCEVEEPISSFESDLEAMPFVYDGGELGRATISEGLASHGRRSLKVEFLAAEWEIRKQGWERFVYQIRRRLGLTRGEEEEKIALLGSKEDTLPFDWQDIEALAFDVYNPSARPVRLTILVDSGFFSWDPDRRRFRTCRILPPGQWTAVRLTPEEMGDALHPDGVLRVALSRSSKGTLYLDHVRLIVPVQPVPRTRLVRLSWTADPRTTQTITWQSRAPKGTVRFGRAGSPLTRSVASRSLHLDRWPHGWIHEATLTGLKPDVRYEYQIRSDGADWDPRRRFRTAPASDEASFTFLAGSDTKGARDIMARLLRQFEADAPRFLIYVGDAPHNGGLPGQWERWFQAIGPFAAEHAVMHAVGNHELGGDRELVVYRAFQALPVEENYYSFDYGPVHFTCLDTESGRSPEQLRWIEEDLRQTDKPWKVAFFHSPLFSSDQAHGSNEELQATLGPIFTRHHVQLVLNGHGHLYERSQPIRVDASGAYVADSYREGTCYVVSGGAGAGLYEATPGNWWTAFVKSTYHLCRIRVMGRRWMELEAVDLEGDEFDRLRFENPEEAPPSAAEPPPNPPGMSIP